MIRRLLALALLGAFASTIAACNTIEGVGKDVKATGEAVEKAAEKNKRY
ncbi:MAG TPA: entericidin A/B family lipoprotein [Casimicrobiaceae bacterium]|nr:entericidin A/B family lipoprotein [Casimicrobiaceae bacterium]